MDHLGLDSVGLKKELMSSMQQQHGAHIMPQGLGASVHELAGLMQQLQQCSGASAHDLASLMQQCSSTAVIPVQELVSILQQCFSSFSHLSHLSYFSHCSYSSNAQPLAQQPFDLQELTRAMQLAQQHLGCLDTMLRRRGGDLKALLARALAPAVPRHKWVGETLRGRKVRLAQGGGMVGGSRVGSGRKVAGR